MVEQPAIELVVGADSDGERLDRFLQRQLPGVSRGALVRLLRAGQVAVEGRRQAKGMRLRAGQRVVVSGAARDERPVPQHELHLPVLLVRPELVAFDKPAGIASHPLRPGETNTVANAIVAQFPECASASLQPREGGLVHRLDWSTSGVLIAARSRLAYEELRGQFRQGAVGKEYLALVGGRVEQAGTVSLPVEPMPADRRRMRAVPDRDDRGQAASTSYEPLAVLGQHTLLVARCRTGRRHQVRAHLAHVGHPLVGDELYGGPALSGVTGAFLHAAALELQELKVEAPLPAERQRLLERLGWRAAP